VRQNGDEAVAVARRAAAGAGFALASDSHSHFVVDACRDLNLGRHLLEHLTGAAAAWARVLDHRALAVALRAGRLNAHDAGRLNHSALATAIAAHFAAAALGSAGALAGDALFVALELDRFRDTVGGLFESERYVATHIAALAPLVARAAAEQVAEQIAECREDVFNVGEMMGAELAIEAGVAVAIVAAALLGVVEHLESFGRFLEPLDCFLVARVFIGVILYGQLTIRRCDLAIGGGSLDA